jgi:hypothetical protein
MKKVLIFLSVFVFALSFLVPFSAVKGISDLSITVAPPTRGAYAEYKVSFKSNVALRGGMDRIYLQFPDECTIPCTSCAYAHCQDCFLINGARVAGAGPYDLPKSVYFVVPSVGVEANSLVTLTIVQAASFMNPDTPGTYTLKVWTSAEPQKIEGTFVISSTKISRLTAIIDPIFTNSKPALSISFTTGALGELKNGKSIYIKFPDSFTLPTNPTNEYVTVNKEHPYFCKVNNNILSIGVSESIPKNYAVSVNIYPSFGLVNPSKEGEYELQVWSDSEPTPVSVKVSIKEKDFVRTVIQTEPLEPNGLNGYFTYPLKVTLLGETNTQDAVLTYYKVDDGDYMEYKEPFTLNEGVHTVSCYSKTTKLTENEQKASFKIDLTHPTLQLNLNPVSYTFENSTTIKGKLSEPGKVYINGNEIQLNSDNSFSEKVDLKEGDNYFEVKGADLAGNEVIQQLDVVQDLTTPVLLVESPKAGLENFVNEIKIKGSVYPPNCLVFLNDKEVKLNEQGIFDFSYVPEDDAGTLIPINLKAIYPLTGKTVEQRFIVTFSKSKTIVLEIGKKEILVSNKVSTIDVAPFIDKSSGRTLVPVRFVSEALGFDVTYNEKTKEVTIKNNNTIILIKIGSKVATVNGKSVTLDVAPVIQNGRTFVPVRFISETMGLRVEWDSNTKRITITN